MASDGTRTSAATTSPGRKRLAGFEFDLLTEAEVIDHIVSESRVGRGGWVATPNIDICQRARRDPALRDLVRGATLVVPDGMPLLWAARLRGDFLAERVTGSSLIFSLSSAAARAGLSVYMLGGDPGVPDLAGTELARRYPGLRVAGADAPPVGFEESPEGVALDANGFVRRARTSYTSASGSRSRNGSLLNSSRASRGMVHRLRRGDPVRGGQTAACTAGCNDPVLSGCSGCSKSREDSSAGIS